MSSLPGVPQKGEILAGKLQVEDVLGAGGMGVVIAARHLVLRQRVAVKFLLPQATTLDGATERFVREARAAVAIQSEHVARVLDVGALENGAPYIVMEFLSGIDLGRALKERGPLPIADAVDFVLQAGEAIAEAHALGIVHRDLKPSNLFLTTRTEGTPLVKVLDFGLSKMEDEGAAPEASLTATGVVLGSPHYMSPEQVRGLKHADWRTDIWALGVILYQLLTGRRPFDGPTLTAVCASIAADTPRPMHLVRPDIPPALDAAVRACLEKEASERTRTVAEMAQALAPFAPARSAGVIDRIARLLPDAATIPLQRPWHDLQRPSMSASTPLSIAAPTSSPGLSQPTGLSQPIGLSQPTPAQSAAILPADPATGHGSAWGNTQGHILPRRPSLALPIAAVIAVAALLGTLGAVAMRRLKPAPSSEAIVASPPVTATAVAATPPEPRPETAPPAPAPTVAPAPPAPSAAPVEIDLEPTASAQARPAPAPPRSASPSTPPKPPATPKKPPKAPSPLDRSD